MVEWWGVLLWCLLALVVGGVAGFFISRFVFQRQMKKNPPINEAMIRAMYRQMGRKPSEAQIRQTMNAMLREQNKK